MTQSKAGRRLATHDRHEGRQYVMKCCHKLEKFCTCGPDAVATCPICCHGEHTGTCTDSCPGCKEVQEFSARVDAICAAMLSDSRVTVDRQRLIDSLAGDLAICGRLPTFEECERLVTGADDGTIPPDLIRDFPQVDTLLSSYF